MSEDESRIAREDRSVKLRRSQEILDSLTPDQWTDWRKVPHELMWELRRNSGSKREIVWEFSDGTLTIPRKVLRGNTQQQKVTLYRGTSLAEWDEAVGGSIRHKVKRDHFVQWGHAKYLTDSLWYARNSKWGGHVIAYTFSGKVLGPIEADPQVAEVQGLLHMAINGVAMDNNLQDEIIKCGCDGVFGTESGVRGPMTYAIYDLTKLKVDIEETRRINQERVERLASRWLRRGSS